MSDSKFKPSFGIDTLLSGDMAAESDKFLLFMKAYYEWMQTTKVNITSTVGTFVRGETIISAGGATAIVKEVVAGELIVHVDTRTPFNLLEAITGQTSGATAIVSVVRDNVIRKTGKILDYRNIETSIDDYIGYLKDELFPSIPITFNGDKRNVALKFKEFFQSKSNEDSYRFLFKLLYNENVEFYYPGEDILRVSDGNFEKTQIIRTDASAFGINSVGNQFSRDIFLFLNKTIRGKTSGFLANVIEIKKFFIGSIEIAEMTLKLVSGTFTAGEDIEDINDTNLITSVYGIISGITIIDGGSGYSDGDIITITGDGSEAQARVSSIKESPISALTINTIGHGYQLNTTATINNSATGGSGLIIKVTELSNTYTVISGANTFNVGEISKVSIINRGEGYSKKPTITLQDTTITSLGLLSDKLINISNAGSNYGVGNTLIFTGGAGSSVAGQVASVVETISYDLLFEDGQQMLADGSYDDIIKNEEWSVLGAIKRIELTNFGTGYTSTNLPTITVNTTTGSSANLIATNIQGKSSNVTVDTSNNITGIGSIRAVEIINFGIDYSTANANASAIGNGNANLIPNISGLGIKEGVFIDDDGKINFKIIQDSFFYQDFSYVIKSGLEFEKYSDTLKSIIHPAGLIFFGEIQILSEIDISPALVNQEYSIIIPSLGFMSYTTESIITTSTTPSIGIIYLENFVDNSVTVADTTYITYSKISGTVSSSVGDSYLSFTLAQFENILIDQIDNVAINANTNVVTGTGTNFVADFNGGDVFVANNEYFIVQVVFDATTLLIDRSPATPFTNVFAYKQTVTLQPFDSINITFDNQILTFDQG